MSKIYSESDLNNYIKFKPTSNGHAVHRKYINDLLGDKLPEVPRDLKVDDDGYVRMQMHGFILIFGKYIGVGNPNPICEMKFLIEVEK